MTYEVTRKASLEIPAEWGSSLFHLTERYGSRTLCAHSCSVDDGWDSVPDRHPEDVDAVDRCGVCYAARSRSDRTPSLVWYAV